MRPTFVVKIGEKYYSTFQSSLIEHRIQTFGQYNIGSVGGFPIHTLAMTMIDVDGEFYNLFMNSNPFDLSVDVLYTTDDSIGTGIFSGRLDQGANPIEYDYENKIITIEVTSRHFGEPVLISTETLMTSDPLLNYSLRQSANPRLPEVFGRQLIPIHSIGGPVELSVTEGVAIDNLSTIPIKPIGINFDPVSAIIENGNTEFYADASVTSSGFESIVSLTNVEYDYLPSVTYTKLSDPEDFSTNIVLEIDPGHYINDMEIMFDYEGFPLRAKVQAQSGNIVVLETTYLPEGVSATFSVRKSFEPIQYIEEGAKIHILDDYSLSFCANAYGGVNNLIYDVYAYIDDKLVLIPEEFYNVETKIIAGSSGTYIDFTEIGYYHIRGVGEIYCDIAAEITNDASAIDYITSTYGGVSTYLAKANSVYPTSLSALSNVASKQVTFVLDEEYNLRDLIQSIAWQCAKGVRWKTDPYEHFELVDLLDVEEFDDPSIVFGPNNITTDPVIFSYSELSDLKTVVNYNYSIDLREENYRYERNRSQFLGLANYQDTHDMIVYPQDRPDLFLYSAAWKFVVMAYWADYYSQPHVLCSFTSSLMDADVYDYCTLILPAPEYNSWGPIRMENHTFGPIEEKGIILSRTPHPDGLIDYQVRLIREDDPLNPSGSSHIAGI